MNLADYLSELLGQHAEVSMPGLGYFMRERIGGYYNDDEARFYPPYHKVIYVPQLKADDLLTRYVAERKNISLATSKYFAEKFVSNLKEQAATGTYIFSDLGSFETDNNQLVFHPNERLVNDYSVYGFAPLDVKKLTRQLPEAEPLPVFEDITPSPVFFADPVEVITPSPDLVAGAVEAVAPYRELHADEVAAIAPETVVADKPKRNWLTSGWFITLIAIVILGLAAWQYFIFNPTAYDKLFGGAAVVAPAKQKAAANTTNKTDTLQDSVTKAAVPVIKVIDTENVIHYEVIAAAEKKMASAQIDIANLKSAGIDARVVKGAPGRYLKISVGTYFKSAQADSAKVSLMKLHKISKQSYTIPIIPKKTN